MIACVCLIKWEEKFIINEGRKNIKDESVCHAACATQPHVSSAWH